MTLIEKTELDRLRSIDDTRPYWLWRAMLEEMKCHEWVGTTEGFECEDSGQCITEWCAFCAARRFLREIEEQERIA
jgi:hypothetical protein